MSAGACVGGAPKNVRDRMAHRRRDTDRSWKPAPSVDPVRAGTCFITTPTGDAMPSSPGNQSGPAGSARGRPVMPRGKKDSWPCHPLGIPDQSQVIEVCDAGNCGQYWSWRGKLFSGRLEAERPGLS